MKNLTCDTARERIALELYGELDAREHAELADHLGDCAPCRDARAEIQRGLGRLPGARARIPRRPRGKVTLPWLTAAAGFAAGLLAGDTVPHTVSPPAVDTVPHTVSLARPEPPPRAVSAGRLAQLGTWMAR